MIIYNCMRTCLLTAIENDIKSMIIPAFGGGCGNVPTQTLCRMMYEGYKQIMNSPASLNWEYAEDRRLETI